MALKIGTEDKKKVIIAAVLGVLVIGLAINVLMGFFGGPSPAPEPPPAQTPVATAPRAGGTQTAATKIPGIAASLDPTLHPEWMAQAESLEYSGKGRNIFSLSSAPSNIEEVKAPVRPTASAAEQQVAQGPPPPPPIELKFFGFEARKDGSRKAFLLHGDDVFIAAEGDVVDHRYRVLKISPFSVQIEDIPYHNAAPLQLQN